MPLRRAATQRAMSKSRCRFPIAHRLRSTMAVWENLVLPASIDVVAAATVRVILTPPPPPPPPPPAPRGRMYLLAYGNGASLAKTILLRNMARMLNHSAYADAGEGARRRRRRPGGGGAIASLLPAALPLKRAAAAPRPKGLQWRRS